MSSTLIRPELVRLGAAPTSKAQAIREAGQLLAAAGHIDPAYVDSLLARENVANTYLGHGVAIPHGMIEHRHLIHSTAIAVLQVPGGIEWNPGQTVHLVFAIAAQSDEHLALLRRLTRLLQDEAALARLFDTPHPADLLAALEQQAPVAEAAEQIADFAHGFDWVMDYPNGLHARPAQQWVETARRFAANVRVRKGVESGDGKNLIALLQLGIAHSETLHVSAEGPDAEALLAALQAVMSGLTAAEQEQADKAAKQQQAQARRALWQPAGKPLALDGIAASPGLAIGQLRVLKPAVLEVPDHPVLLGTGGDQLDAALAATRLELQDLAAATGKRMGATEAGIFRAQAELLNDTDLITLTCQLMVEGHGVAWAWHQAVSRLAERLAALGNPLLAARAADLRDVGLRVLDKLAPELGTRRKPLDEGSNLIIAAADLTPSDTAALDPQRIIGLCTAQGGPSSHTAIIARTVGLPALVALGSSLLDLPDGATAIIDGDSGRLYLNADEADLASARQWIARQQEAARKSAAAAMAPATTQDGKRIEVAANANHPEQAAAAVKAGAEGVGLMRTEFLFLERDSAPSEDEQYQTYRGMLDALQGKPLIVRTLDIGGDKQVPYLNLPHEENPFLGVRGVRLLLRRPDLLEPQLRAIYRAASHGPLSIMFPMITSLEEVKALRAVCERIRQELAAPEVPLGIMVEVPAAVAMADQLAEHVDFFSIGTNDLTQYVLAIDRQHPELAREADALHPAVLRMIRQTVEGASRHNRWVGVCGGIAGDPLGAAILAGLGVQELSMSQRDIANVKAMLRRCSSGHLARLAADALRCPDVGAVRALAARLESVVEEVEA